MSSSSRPAPLVTLALTLFALACSPASGDPPTPESMAHDDHAGETFFDSTDLKTTLTLEGEFTLSAPLFAEEGATRGGFLLDRWADVADAPVSFEVRGVYDDGAVTDWVSAEITWQEGPHVVGRADLPDEVVATQFRIPTELTDHVEFLTYASVKPEAQLEDADDDGLGKTQHALRSDLSTWVKSRADWGARSSSCSSNTSKHRIAIHHTETPFSASGGYAARLRATQAYHMDSRGWCDIGYHFLVTSDGAVWEGRPLDRLGSHVGGNNSGNVGVSYVGCFHPGSNCTKMVGDSKPPQAMIDGGGKIVGQIAKIYGISVDASTVKGHRDHSGASTDCPGNDLHARLGDIRSIAKNGAPPPPSAPPPPTAPPASGDWSCSGVAGTTRSATGKYYVTSFGCWIDDSGKHRGDPSDNCIPWCQGRGSAKFDALCPGMSGPDCERKLGWYTAGADRFGCGSRLRVTNPKTGKSAVVAVIDRGPACWVEDKVDHWVLDLSYPASYYLFGEPKAATEKGAVTVEEVSDATPLGPWTGATPPAPAPTPPPASATGTALGVVWDLATGSSPASASAKRLGNATLSIDGGPAQPVRASDAYWTLQLAAGTHTLVVTAPGYDTQTSTLSVSAGGETWASVGLWPAAASSSLDVRVLGSNGAPLAGAIVHLPGVGANVAGSDGRTLFEVEGGSIVVEAYGSGHQRVTRTVAVTATTSHTVDVQLPAAVKPSVVGGLQGVVWDLSKSSSPSSTTARLDQAIVLSSSGHAQRVRAGDAYFRFDTAPGTYTFTVLAQGFGTQSFSKALTAGKTDWGSVGLSPAP